MFSSQLPTQFFRTNNKILLTMCYFSHKCFAIMEPFKFTSYHNFKKINQYQLQLIFKCNLKTVEKRLPIIYHIHKLRSRQCRAWVPSAVGLKLKHTFGWTLLQVLHHDCSSTFYRQCKFLMERFVAGLVSRFLFAYPEEYLLTPKVLE